MLPHALKRTPIVAAVVFSIGLNLFPMAASAHSVDSGATLNPALLSALEREGGGPEKFSAQTMRLRLGGVVETQKLNRTMGSAAVARFDRVFTFAVDDGIATMRQHGISLPSPHPVGSKNVARALFRAGSYDGKFSVERLFDALFSPSAHMHAMMAVEKKYGSAGETAYHQVFGRLVADVGGNGASINNSGMENMGMSGSHRSAH